MWVPLWVILSSQLIAQTFELSNFEEKSHLSHGMQWLSPYILSLSLSHFLSFWRSFPHSFCSLKPSHSLSLLHSLPFSTSAENLTDSHQISCEDKSNKNPRESSLVAKRLLFGGKYFGDFMKKEKLKKKIIFCYYQWESSIKKEKNIFITQIK